MDLWSVRRSRRWIRCMKICSLSGNCSRIWSASVRLFPRRIPRLAKKGRNNGRYASAFIHYPAVAAACAAAINNCTGNHSSAGQGKRNSGRGKCCDAESFPGSSAGKYKLYDNKICTGDEAAECRHCMARRMESVGYKVVVNRGDYH